MKDVYNPTKEDIVEWSKSDEAGWPVSDWNYYVMSNDGENDSLVFELADSLDCNKRLFFLDALYYFVGSYFHSEQKKEKNKKRIEHPAIIFK